jgi:hypothetical protein
MFRLADEQRAKVYFGKAILWVKETEGLFGSARLTATSAVAEFIANQDGYTLHERRAIQ